MPSAKFKKGSAVEWNWAGRKISGHVQEIFTEPTTRTIKGKKIKRHASAEAPAYLVLSNAGNSALKLESELKAATTKRVTAKTQPKMFGL